MYSQTQTFILFFIIGIIIAIIFDFFKVLRKTFKTNDFFTTIEDIIFLLLVGLIITFSIFKLNNGILRLFIFLSIFLGISIYSLTISNFCVIILYTLISTFKKIIFFPVFLVKNLLFSIKKKVKK